MQSEFIAVPPDWTVGQAIDYMRDTPDLPDRFYEIYAVDPTSTGRARSRSTRCCGRAGRCRSPI
jgi:Mg/Co/Ni transporter MgtE